MEQENPIPFEMFLGAETPLHYTRWLCVLVLCRQRGVFDNTKLIQLEELADYEPEGVA